MRKRVLFSACALAACFAACTNDDFQQDAQNSAKVPVDGQEVIGADLVAQGMTIVPTILDGDNATTRVMDGKWEGGDSFGLAWYNFSTSGIKATQSSSDYWSGSNWNYTDNNIYANHRFILEGNSFVTYTDVYQGAYFVYFPYKRLGETTPKTISINEGIPQTGTFAWERQNQLLHISAQDFVEKSDVDEEGKLEKDFFMTPAANALGVVATPNEAISGSEYLSKMIITKMEIKANGSNNEVFVDGGVLRPRQIPKVEYLPLSTQIDEKATREALDAAAAKSTDPNNNSQGDYLEQQTTATSSVVTNINANFNLANDNTLRAFIFPIQKGVTYNANEYPEVDITVSRTKGDGTEDYALGTFNVNNGNSKVLIDNLKSFLDATNASADMSLTKIMRINGVMQWPCSVDNMTANLTVNDFTPATSNITSVPQWNDLVALVNALKAAGKKDFNEVTFKLGADLYFDDEIAAPEGVKIILDTNSHKLVVNSGVVDWPSNIVLNAANTTTKIVVADGATLRVGIELEEEIVLNATSITNNGTIEAGAEASISTATGKALDNTNGTVIVDFGAYVYPSKSETTGVIAYEVEDNSVTTMGNINTLIALQGASGQVEYAQVNTLILINGVELDLNAMASEAEDNGRYEESIPAGYLASLENIDIIMRGGTIICKDIKNEKLNSMVKNITVESGENTIYDVRPQGNITVGEEGTLTIESRVYPYVGNTDLKLNDNALIDNNGTLKVNTSVYTKDFDNETGHVIVATGETLWYTGVYTQGGIAEGYVLKKYADPTTYEDLSDKAKSVVTTFNTYAESISATSFEELCNDWTTKKSSPSERWGSTKFYKALSDWFTSVGLPALSTSPYQDLSVTMFETFQNMTGYQLF